jgi:hypothetical protein
LFRFCPSEIDKPAPVESEPPEILRLRPPPARHDTSDTARGPTCGSHGARLLARQSLSLQSQGFRCCGLLRPVQFVLGSASVVKKRLPCPPVVQGRRGRTLTLPGFLTHGPSCRADLVSGCRLEWYCPGNRPASLLAALREQTRQSTCIGPKTEDSENGLVS